MMRKGLDFTGAAALLMLLAACSAPPEEASKASQPEAEQANVFSETTATMDRARAVQGDVDQRARELEQAEQAQGR